MNICLVCPYLPAIVVVSTTERQLSKCQPYHRCFRLRVDVPMAARFLVLYIIEITTEWLVSAGEVVAIFCKVAPTYCENKENNGTSINTD